MSITLFLCFSHSLLAQNKSRDSKDDAFSLFPFSNTSTLFFFDASSSHFKRDGEKQVFEGEVVAIGAGTLIGADRITIDHKSKTLEASGHVMILNQNQVFTGDLISLIIDSGDFYLTNAVMIVNDEKKVDAIIKKILGFTKQELSFEMKRHQIQADIAERKAALHEQYRLIETDEERKKDLVEKYALLLEQEDLAKNQENPALARLGEKQRRQLKQRRFFWEESRKSMLAQNQSAIMSESFFKLSGTRLERTNGNDYTMHRAVFTPCLCDEDESPAWSIRSERVETQVGGYADLYHPVIEVKGLPILYLPYLKIPIKNRRQSGFLMPTFSFDSHSGNILSQPVYLDFAPNSDGTVTADFFQKRGTRVGTEFRHQQGEYSGWKFKVEGIRDELWLAERGRRDDLLSFYSEGLTEARNPDSTRANGTIADLAPYSGKDFVRRRLEQKEYWNSLGLQSRQFKDCLSTGESEAGCQEKLKSTLVVPDNTTRGSASWQGLTLLAPRLSVVSRGELMTDHRYAEELYIPGNIREALTINKKARSFVTSKAKVHLDGRDFYAGIGSTYGDNVTSRYKYQGQQLPVSLHLQSRYFSLDRSNGGLVPSPVPIYGQILGDFRRIDEYKVERSETVSTLGAGNWRRTMLKTTAPLFGRSVIQVDHFAEVEARYIDHQYFSPHSSTIQTARTGLRFQLPIDGQGRLPDFLQPSPDIDAPKSERFLQHLMNWSIILSWRPSVVRRGPYGERDPETEAGGLTYFISDRTLAHDPDFGLDDGALPEDILIKHERVTFKTQHNWRVFSRGWKLLPPESQKGVDQTTKDVTQKKESMEERARRELLFSIDRPVTNDQDIYSNNMWHINRYQLANFDYLEPVSFGASITYDHYKAKLMQQDKKRNAELEELASVEPDPVVAQDLRNKEWTPIRPWENLLSDLSVRWQEWNLVNHVEYDIYDDYATKVDLTLAFPTVLKTAASVSYTVAKTANKTSATGNFVLTEELVRTGRLVTNLVPYMTITGEYARKNIENGDPPELNSKTIGVIYQSPAKCWGLSFLRKKDFDKNEKDASYVLQLSVIFMAQERPLPDMYTKDDRTQMN